MEADGGSRAEGARTETMDVLRRRDLPRRALRDYVRRVEGKDQEGTAWRGMKDEHRVGENEWQKYERSDCDQAK